MHAEFAKTLNNQSSAIHPILNLVCKESTFDFKTKFIQAIKDHERNVCKECKQITVGTAHKTNHEKIKHGKESLGENSHPLTTCYKQKRVGATKKINRKVKKLQLEVSKLNKDGNIFNNLLNIPEIPDIQKIKEHFNKTVTT